MWLFRGPCISGKQPLLAQEGKRSVRKLPPQVAHPPLLQPSLLPASHTTLTQTWVGKEDSSAAFGKDFFPCCWSNAVPGAESRAEDPPVFPLHHHHPALAHNHASSSQWQTSITEAQSSKCFQLIPQTFCTIHHSFLHTPFWRIQCWKWSEIRI